jgi:alkanesulfonate monooxygenase SsuD/methylene tetrahydromethanopterin reductase-like flavin-dependent oxidoreductase (luciferase family)
VSIRQVGLVLQSSADPSEEARLFESLGYDYAGAGEHVSFNVPVGNSFITLAAAAGATTKLRLMNTVALAPLYPAGLFAKLSAALGMASRGRFDLGVGIGGENPAEFDACGVPVRERGARTNEALEVLRLLWTTDSASFKGRFCQFDGVTISPRPDPLPTVWVSGRSEAAMHRAARYGDGWFPYLYTADKYARSMTTIAEHRDPAIAPIRGGLFFWGCVHTDRATAQEYAVEALSRTYAQDFAGLVGRLAFAGTPDDVIGQINAYANVGVEMLMVSFACPRSYLDEARRLFTEKVLPVIRPNVTT